MKRLHVHISVADLERSKAFYSALFGVPPTVLKDDYAKWRIDDPAVNLAISKSKSDDVGVDHLGIDIEDPGELAALSERLAAAEEAVAPQEGAQCCYARSDKAWTRDPSGVVWEAFHSHGQIETFGGDLAPRTELEKAPRADENSFEGVCCG